MARFRALSKSPLFTALDLGSSKVCCLIARVESGRTRILGVGIQKSAGLKGGFVTDTAALENVILNAVNEAEQTAGETISEVYLNLNDASLQSRLVRMETQVGGGEIETRHVEQLLERARQSSQKLGMAENRQPVHTFPIEYIVDFEKGLKDPRGLFSEQLAATFLAVSADALNAKTLLSCVQRCHLNVRGYSTSAYASGLSVLAREEREDNATLIDIGGGLTSLIMFRNGVPGHVETLPIGGNHITRDIAHALSISFQEAERLKTLYASAMPDPSSGDATIEVMTLGDHGMANRNLISKSMLVGIVQPRLEELFELVSERIEASPMYRSASRRVTLVGGTSRIHRISELAALVLERKVRLGMPGNLVGASELHRGPEFSVLAGLLKFALADSGMNHVVTETENITSGDLIAKNTTYSAKRGGFGSKGSGRIGHWLRTYF